MKILDEWWARTLAWCWRLDRTPPVEMFQSLFNEAKAAEVVAFLLNRSAGAMDVLKLMKLAYLVERASYEQYGEPLIGDVAYSMDHGPVLSRLFNLARSESKIDSAIWSAYIAPSNDMMVKLKHFGSFTEDDLLNLSEADIQILSEIWDRFGHLTGFELSDYTHTLPEYEKPKPGGRLQINQVKLLKALGLTEKQAHKCISSLLAHNRAKEALSQSS